MFFAPGVTLTPITLLGSGCGVSTVGIDRVAVEGSDVATVDGIDGGSVEGCVVERVGPVHQGN